jgi:O-antigen/teichoic acid export membrane protein
VLLLFFHLFDVPVQHVHEVKVALAIVGVNLAVTFPLMVFDGTLWASERFDLINFIDIPSTLARTLLSLLLVWRGYGLVGLAVLGFVATTGNMLIKMGVSFHIDRSLRLGFGYVRKEIGKKLYGFGFWSFLLQIGREIRMQVGPLMVGTLMNVALVTPFSIAVRLINYAGQVLVASTGVLTPVATALHAQERHAEQRRLFVQGGKYCFALALYFIVLFLWLGEPLIHLWMGPKLESAVKLLMILAIGEALPMSQWVTYSMILGRAQHWPSALATILESAAAIVLAMVLVKPYGLEGICIGFAASGMICRGLFQIIYGCRMLKMSVGNYLLHAMLPALTAAILPAAGLALMVRWAAPGSWGQLFIYGGVFSVVYGAIGMLFLGWHDRRRHGVAVQETIPLTNPMTS